MLLIAYGVFVALVAAWPTPVDRGLRGPIDRVIAALHRRGVPDWVDYNVVEFTANIGFFVPLGFLVCLLLAWRMQWLALAIIPLISMAIEGMQLLFLAERYATWNDVLANSIGGYIGIGLCVLARWAVRVRDRSVIEHALWGLRP